MNDFIDQWRLRRTDKHGYPVCDSCYASADEIERLYKEVERLRSRTVTLPPLGPADLLVESGQGFVEGWTIQRVKDYATECLRAAGIEVTP